MYSRSNPRRCHSAEFKAAVMAACDEPGASVAAVAQAHGLNANLVHQWRRGRGAPAAAVAAPVTALSTEASPVINTAPVFIPVELPPPVQAQSAAPASAPQAEAPQEIHIELRRGAVTVNVRWPMQAAAQFAAWLREILR